MKRPGLSQTQRLSVVIAISFAFFVAEISVGFSTRSLALIADAFHYLNDLVGFVVALTAIQISNRGRSPKEFSFGWQRARLLGAFFNGVFLAALGLSIFLQAIERFIHIERVENPKLVLIIGAIGLGLNIISAVFLHEHAHDHGHGHSHGGGHEHGSNSPSPTSSTIGEHLGAAEAARLSFNAAGPGLHANHRHTTNTALMNPGRDLGMLGVFLHVIGDAINNVGVIVSALAIWLGKTQGRFYADPAVSMAISFMIFGTSIPIVSNSGRILLQSSPVGVDVAEVKKDLEDLPGVCSVHELHIWRLNQQKTVASAHLVTEDDSLEGFMAKAKEVGQCLHAYGVHSITLQPEPRFRGGTEVQATAGAEGQDWAQDRTSHDGANGVELGEMRQRAQLNGHCRLKCEKDACKDLQCCDDE